MPSAVSIHGGVSRRCFPCGCRQPTCPDRSRRLANHSELGARFRQLTQGHLHEDSSGASGETADLTRAEGGVVNDVRFVLGLRVRY